MDMETCQPAAALKWLFFDLNSFFASVEQQERPELRGRPIAVVPSQTDSTCAIAASYEAKKYGIKTGTKIYDAKRMCPELICVLARHDTYVAYHHRILKVVDRVIPIEKVCSIDEAACRLMNGQQNAATATQIAHDLKEGLRLHVGEHVKCSIGVAQNMFLAKTATDMEKPDGLVILPPNAYKDQLFKLGLGDLCGIGINMERRLYLAGIRSIEQLWNLSPKHARKVWGSVAGEVFWYRLRGFDIPDRPTQKRVVGHSRILDPNHRPSDAAYPIVQQLTLKACARLRRYGLYARRYSLSVRTQVPKPQRSARWAQDITFAPASDNATMLRALRQFWPQMQADTRRANLKKVSITLSDLQETAQTIPDLFEQPTRAKDQRLSKAIDTLNTRYGKQTITLGALAKTSAGYVGTKIAFNRIPELEEFHE